MIRPKYHLEKIYRTPAVEKTRMDSLRMDKNEFLSCWPKEWFRDFVERLKPEHLSVHPELGSLYGKLERTLNVSQENIVVTAGSDAAIQSTFEVFVEPTDEVVIPSPTFAMYYIYTQVYRANLVEVHYDEKLRLDVGSFIDSLNQKTKLVAIANPNSPTGTIIEQNNLLKIIETASKFGAVVLIDEAYYPFYEESMINFVNQFDNLVITRTFSKAAGLAGMRVGFLVSNKKISKMIFAVKPMYEITTVSTLLAEYVLDNYDRVFEYAKRTREGKDYLADFFIKKGYEIFAGFANFLHVDFGRSKNEIITHLAKHNVLFKHAFEHPALRRFSRFTVGPKESIEPFIKIFNKFEG